MVPPALAAQSLRWARLVRASCRSRRSARSTAASATRTCCCSPIPRWSA
ncbi:hypothetical protein [Kitasatospora fiedleri]|nr:hypothetical protein [Kitasatospora fiedleri]